MDPLKPLLLPVWSLEKNKTASFNSSSLGWRLLECHGSPFVPDPGVSSPPFPRCSLVIAGPATLLLFYSQGGGDPPADPCEPLAPATIASS